MEAGYDYTLLGERPRSNSRYLPALFVAVLAGILLFSGLAYYGFASGAEAGQVADATAEAGDIRVSENSDGNGVAAAKYTHRVAPASAEDIAGQQLYPAGLSESRYWVNPLGYEQ
jgi:hypothetical protein